MGERTGEMPWHVIHGDTLKRMLDRCAAGEDPELVYIEEYANAERDGYRNEAERYVPVVNTDGKGLYLIAGEDHVHEGYATCWEAEWMGDEAEFYAAVPVFRLVPAANAGDSHG